MEKIRSSLFVKYTLLLFSFFIFNYSIDVPDAHNDLSAEDLSYNDIESVSEFFIEIVLGIEDFVPENNDDDSDERTSFLKKIDLQLNGKIIILSRDYYHSMPIINNFPNPFSIVKNPFTNGLIKPPQA
jgi:hypothetical protein